MDVSLPLSGVPMADWNSKSHLADIYGVVTNLRLPWFHYKDQSAMEWGPACHDVWAFVSNVVKKRCNSAVSLTTRSAHFSLSISAPVCLSFLDHTVLFLSLPLSVCFSQIIMFCFCLCPCLSLSDHNFRFLSLPLSVCLFLSLGP